MVARYHYASLESTQDQAFELLDQEVAPPFYVTADECRSLRGRRNRAWSFEPGRSLAFSLAVRLRSDQLSGLSLVIGLSLLRQLESSHLKLKWPNDLMLGDSKVGGVLVESRIQGVRADLAIGVGLNCFDLEHSSYKGLDRDLKPEELVEAMVLDMETFRRHSFSHFSKEYSNCLWKKGEVVCFEANGEIREVQILGVDDEGQLLASDGSSYRLDTNGEILYAKEA